MATKRQNNGKTERETWTFEPTADILALWKKHEASLSHKERRGAKSRMCNDAIRSLLMTALVNDGRLSDRDFVDALTNAVLSQCGRVYARRLAVLKSPKLDLSSTALF